MIKYFLCFTTFIALFTLSFYYCFYIQKIRWVNHNLKSVNKTRSGFPNVNWMSVDSGELFNLPQCDAITSSLCSFNAFTYNISSALLCKQNNKIRATLFYQNHRCKYHYYTFDETVNLFRNKSILFIGDSRVRYQFVSILYWLTYRKWPSSGISNGYKSLTNEHHWNYLGNDEGWRSYYRDAEKAMKGKLKIDAYRGILDPELENVELVRLGENWYYEDLANDIKLSFYAFYETQISIRYPFYPSNYQNAKIYPPMHMHLFLEQVVPLMNITHLIYEAGWGNTAGNNSITDALLILIDKHNLHVTYNTGYSGPGLYAGYARIDQPYPNAQALPLNVSKIHSLDMCSFCTAIKKQMVFLPNFIPGTLRWDDKHFYAWFYEHTFQFLLHAIFQ